MKKTDFTFSHSIRTVRSIVTAMVFLMFLGLGTSVYAQGISTTPAGSSADVIFKDYDFIQDKSAAVDLLMNEVLVIQNNATDGSGEAEQAMNVYFLLQTAAKLNADESVLSALSRSYSELQTFAQSNYAVTVDLEGIAESVADLLD